MGYPIEKAWNAVEIRGNPFKVLDGKLWATARALSSWSSKVVGNIKIQILVCIELIHRLYIVMEARQLTEDELGLRRTLKKKLLGLSCLERTMVRLRLRLIFLLEGDGNTS